MISDTDLDRELQNWATHARNVSPPPIPATATWQATPHKRRRLPMVLAGGLATVAAAIVLAIYVGGAPDNQRDVQIITGPSPGPTATPSQRTSPTATSSSAGLGMGTDPTGGCPNPVDQAKRSATSPKAWTLRSGASSSFEVSLPLRNLPGVTLGNLRAHLTTASGVVQSVTYLTIEPSMISVNGQPLTLAIRALDQQGRGLNPGTYSVHITFQDDCGGRGGPVTADVPEGQLTVTK